MPQNLPVPGEFLGNYCVTCNQRIEELNLTAITLKHESTGARHLHLACSDPNNVFAVGFRTPPPDSTGVAHILEHTVLCGSERYPVRDPFFAMLKRSLNTFMNAMTASDWTFYPVASMNPKDLANLMQIYLDAVFFPLLRETDFQQEGHRIEFAVPDDPRTPLQIKGVVFNEMKGAMADPSSLLSRRLNRALYPDNSYGENSGGEPSVIPDLTWEQLRDFHSRYYHPSNSWMFTYGNMPLENHLKRIEDLALARFSKNLVASDILLQPRFTAPKQIEETFPIERGGSVSRKSMVQLAWLTCPIENHFERAATNILTKLLLGSPAAPLYQALIDSKFGHNLSPGTGYHDDYRDTYLAVGLQGTDPDHIQSIESLIMSTLDRLASDGFPDERIAAALHQYEFSSLEVIGDHYPYGLSLMMRLLGPWLHTDNPLAVLQINKTLKLLRQSTADPSFFPNLIRSRLLDNPHRITLLLKPDVNHAEREERLLNARIEKIRQSLDPLRKKQLVNAAHELQKIQETSDDTSCLPSLELEDIPPEETAVPFKTSQSSDHRVYWFDQPTNGITYLTLQFDLANLSEELMIHVPLFCALLPQIGAAGQDYLTMSRRISAATGGIRFGTNILEDPNDLDVLRPVIDMKAKVLDRNQEKLVEIIVDLVNAPDFKDLKRLRTVISQVKTSLENSIPGSGHSFAARAAAAGLTSSAHLRELWSGMTQLRHILRICDYSDQDFASFAAQLEAIKNDVMQVKRTAFAVCAETNALNTISQPLHKLIDSMTEGDNSGIRSHPDFHPQPEAIGWCYNLPVAYVAQVFRTIPYAHPDAPSLKVLAKLLRANYLHREIREKGGAYGGMAGYSADGGIFSMLSYRDPHLIRTLNVYKDAVEWACQGAFSKEMVKEAILASFGELDRPLSPGGRGYHEFILQQQGIPPEMRREVRIRLKAVDKESLRKVANIYLNERWGQSCVGMLTGEEMYRNASKGLRELNVKIEKL